MKTPAKYHSDQLRDYSSLFSRSKVLSWLNKDFSSIDFKIKRYDEGWQRSKSATYLDYLRYAYSVILKNYQNEYVFKNELLNEWLISELGKGNSKIFSEFRVGQSIADLTMFNGCSTIFEIKTEYDSDARLRDQLTSYRKAFNKIYLVIPESKLSVYNKYDEQVGLIIFNQDSTSPFCTYREARESTDIDPISIMGILHSNEYKSVVRTYFGCLPRMTSFNQFDKCSELVSQIPSIELNRLFIDELKERGAKNVLSRSRYKEFNQLFLAHKMNRIKKDDFISLLKTPIRY